MLRVVFLGMDLRILDTLRTCPVNLCGAYVPPVSSFFLYRTAWLKNIIPRFIIKKKIRVAAAFAGVFQYLEYHQIPALPAKNVNSQTFLKKINGCEIDLCVVANFDQKLGRRLLSIPRYGCINYHPSLLPKYRGPHPFGHILLNEEKISGATWHFVSERIDAGDILAQRQFEIDNRDKEVDLDKKAVSVAIEMLGPLLRDIPSKRIGATPQDESQATYFPKLTKQQKVCLAQRRKR